MPLDTTFFDQAAGRLPADLLLENVRLVDVFSGVVAETSVSVGSGRILGFGPREARQTLDGAGRFLLPGLIDAHAHIESSMLCPARFAEVVLPRGTTTVVADPHEIANVKGLDGIRYMLESTRQLPLDVRIMLPSCVPALPGEDAGATLEAPDLAPLLADARVPGLGEMMNTPGVLAGDPAVLAKIADALACGKRVDGHSPGLSGRALDAYAAAGVATDHECTTVDEMLGRIRRGMYVLLREGSAAHDLANLLPGVTPENARRCLFCTDDRHVADILKRGHIDTHLRMAVAAGLDPLTAVRMATLNAAECYGLRGKGGIAPGWAADMILVDDLRDFNVRAVWAGGRLIAENGRMLAALPHQDPGKLRDSVRLAPLPPNPFALRVPSGRARVIRLVPHSLLTENKELDVRVTPEGFFRCELNPGLLKIAVLERHHATGKIGLGLLDANYGLRGGAIATTIAHDSHNIVVAGDNDADMELAVREVARLKGGIVMTADGAVLAALPLPIGGLMSDGTGLEVAEKLREMLALAKDYYRISDEADAFMTLSFLALPVIPHLKITPNGLFDVDGFERVAVEVGV